MEQSVEMRGQESLTQEFLIKVKININNSRKDLKKKRKYLGLKYQKKRALFHFNDAEIQFD